MGTIRKATNKLLDLLQSVIINKFPEILNNNVRVLDLFSGDGTISLHLCQYINVEYIIFIDKNLSCISNINKKLSNPATKIKGKGILTDISKMSIKMQFGLIIIDPPYNNPQLINIAIKKIRNLMHNKCLIIIKLHKNEFINPHSANNNLKVYTYHQIGITNLLFVINYTKP